VIQSFHSFVKSGNADEYRKYVEAVKAQQPISFKDMMELVPKMDRSRSMRWSPPKIFACAFTTAGMSLGALSPEAHETLAIAMTVSAASRTAAKAVKIPSASHAGRMATWRTPRSNRWRVDVSA